MERTRQKSREKTARRGHKLLKDKSDEMLRNFLQLIKQNRILRAQVEGEIARSLQLFMTARVNMATQEIENAVDSCRRNFDFAPSTQNIMGLVVPRITLDIENFLQGTAPAYLTTHTSFDKSLSHLYLLLMRLAELANVEKACTMLAVEIEKNRRRINALEYVVIPQIGETIDYISEKLAENERSNLVRLMKVKEMIEADILARRQQDET